jgi:hypothetical protein
MSLEPKDAIPAGYLCEPVAAPEEEKAAEMSDAAFAALVGVAWLAGAGWLEWNNFHTWWVSALLLSGFGFTASGYLRGKLADFPAVGFFLLWIGFYIYCLVAADSIQLRVWLGIWLFGAFMLFGNALPTSETPDPRQEPQDRGPELS